MRDIHSEKDTVTCLLRLRLAEMYDAEGRHHAFLSRTIRHVRSPSVKDALEDSLLNSLQHLQLLQSVGSVMDLELLASNNIVVSGLILQAEEELASLTPGSAYELCVLSASTRINDFLMGSASWILALLCPLELKPELKELIENTREKHARSRECLSMATVGHVESMLA